jgi:hypothetical protein
MKNGNELLEKYQEEIKPIFDQIRDRLFDIVNRDTDPAALEESIYQWLKLRERINAEEHAGVLLSLKDLQIVFFPLTGDATRDVGQGKSSIN